MQPLQYDLRSPAAKDNSITNAATARSNLDAAITMRSAETELQNTIELRATASEIVAPKPDGSRRQSEKKTILKHFLKGFLEGKSLAPKWRKSADKSLWQPSCSHSNTIYEVQLQKTIVLPMQPQHEATLTQPFTLRERSYSCKAQWNSIGNSSTSNTCNPIYIAGTILELQITMEFHRQLIHQHHLQSHLHCGNDPTVANHNGILSTAHARNTVETPFTMQNRSEHDAPMIRPHTRPSRNRRTAEVDHRGSGTDFVWKNIGFRASAISQKRISCETSFKTPSATPPPAPLAMPFALRERSYSCKSQWNSIGNSSTSTTCNPIYIAGTILQLQITMEFCRPHMHEKQVKPHLQCGTDPSMIRPHTRPSRTRRTAEVDHRGSGTDFVWKNIGFRASAISQKRISCETSFKTPSATPPPAPLAMPFALRERSDSCKSQWNSIGNSSASTTCNPIYIAGTILQLQITMEFCRPHMHETQVKPHLQCGTDPSMIRPHTRPSRTRRTAEVDHRGSGTDFVWKNIGFRASAISQKRISCETSFKNPT